eukprot:m.84574 g.84574  ORF g.84574 m.84574 type:complete len:346 (-) comp25769_c0_seq2:395-1432(-)
MSGYAVTLGRDHLTGFVTGLAFGGCVAAAFIIGTRTNTHNNNNNDNSEEIKNAEQNSKDAVAHDPEPLHTPPTMHGTPLLPGRVVIVTGGSSGIGREIALTCASHGAKVLVMDVREEPLEGGVCVVEAWSACLAKSKVDGSSFTNGLGAIEYYKGDTTSSDSCEAAVALAVSKWGRLDIWVNNAAIGVGGNLLDTHERDWDRVLAVNAKGYWLGAKAAVRHMLKQDVSSTSGLRGRVINISSQHGMVACPGDIAYGVGKAAAVYMTRQIAVDYASQHIACNAVAPGKIVTGLDSDNRAYSLQRTPCPRLGIPSDVASAVLFLASDLCSNFITGVNLMVDGGWMCK